MYILGIRAVPVTQVCVRLIKLCPNCLFLEIYFLKLDWLESTQALLRVGPNILNKECFRSGSLLAVGSPWDQSQTPWRAKHLKIYTYIYTVSFYLTFYICEKI